VVGVRVIYDTAAKRPTSSIFVGWVRCIPMEVSLSGLRIFVAIAGPLVLVSYVLGVLRAESPEALWGGMEGSLRTAIIPFMFVAAAGFLLAAFLLLLKIDATTLASFHWPWAASDGKGMSRIFWAYVLYLVPSALWLESTLLHIQYPNRWTQALVICVLTLVSVGLLMLCLLAISAIQDGVPGAYWLLVAVVAMAIQSTINDNIIWVAKFPWVVTGK
jgi:hypothetical protein